MTVKFQSQWARAVDCTCDAKDCHHCGGRGCKGDAHLEVSADGKSSGGLTRDHHFLCQRCFTSAERHDIMGTSRDMPGRKNKARRAPVNSWASLSKREGSHIAATRIGRRKTVRTKAGRLISRRSQKAVKRAMFRESSRSKMLACHACNRKDFMTEKSLKAHTAKFHTPGAKSPRGFRTRRDA